MAKRIRTINIEKLIKEGRGQGRGSDYKPWITIQDVPSLGRVSRIRGIKTNRQHEFLSDLERDYFYFLEYSDNVVDIREQFPLLPLEETQYIATSLGLQHPRIKENNKDIVMTTDFLVTLRRPDGSTYDIARTIKPKNNLTNKRVIEKFEIERVYWENQQIDWGIVTDNDMDKTIAHNILFFHSYYDISCIDSLQNIDNNYLLDLIFEYINRIIDSKKSIRYYSSKFDKDMCLEPGTGLSIFKHLLARKKIRIDLSVPFNPDNITEVTLVNEENLKEVHII